MNVLYISVNVLSGSGIGGSSVSYYLRENLSKSDVSITVFDSGRVGGRLATTKIAGREYETGGSIIHPANRKLKLRSFIYFGYK